MRRAIIIAAVLAAGAAGAFDASPLLQFVTAQSFTPLTLGPVAWWRMDDNAASTVVVDSAGTNTGTAAQNTSAMATNGINGGALAFNGSSDSVNCGSANELNSSGGLTICAWVKISDAQQNKGIVTKYFAGGGQRGYGLFTDENAVTRKITFGYQRSRSSYNAADTVTSASALPSNTWAHVSAVFIPSTSATIYINGAQDAQDTAVESSVASNTAVFYLGRSGDAGQALKGAIDDVLIFNRALTQSEITQLYNWRQQ